MASFMPGIRLFININGTQTRPHIFVDEIIVRRVCELCVMYSLPIYPKLALLAILRLVCVLCFSTSANSYHQSTSLFFQRRNFLCLHDSCNAYPYRDGRPEFMNFRSRKNRISSLSSYQSNLQRSYQSSKFAASSSTPTQLYSILSTSSRVVANQ